MARLVAVTSKGPVRETNQDACCLLEANSTFGEVAMLVVCDGVGGMSHGERASGYVVGAFARWFSHTLPQLMASMRTTFAERDVAASWANVLDAAHEHLHALAKEHGHEACGTTFTGVLGCSGSYVVGQVGDSRLYRLDAHGMEQLTQDQTYVAQLVRRGEIAASEAADHPYRNVILQAVGAQTDLCPVFSTGTYAPGDLFVACSDGAYRVAGSTGIRQAFGDVLELDEPAMERACRKLLASDIAEGETDNLTVACLAMGEATRDRATDGTVVAGDDGLW